MPIREYACCGIRIEQLEGVLGAEPEGEAPICRRCGQPMQRLISRSSFQLRGDGWYAPSPADKSPATD